MSFRAGRERTQNKKIIFYHNEHDNLRYNFFLFGIVKILFQIFMTGLALNKTDLFFIAGKVD